MILLSQKVYHADCAAQVSMKMLRHVLIARKESTKQHQEKHSASNVFQVPTEINLDNKNARLVQKVGSAIHQLKPLALNAS
jgi:hypothetical protein